MRQLSIMFMSSSLAALFILLLIVAQDLLIPLVIAMLLWFVLITLAEGIRSLPKIGKYIPNFFALLGAIIISAGVISLIVRIVQNNITVLAENAPNYQEKLTRIGLQFISFIDNQFGYHIPLDFSMVMGEINFVAVIGMIAKALTATISLGGIILIYVLFMLFESHSFDSKLSAMMTNNDHLIQVRGIIQKVSQQIKTYVVLKTILSVAVGFFSYLVLVYFEIDFPQFWALMIFLLNYIPTVGAVIATIFPCLMALLEYESFGIVVLLAIILTSIHFVIGNLIEPRLIGSSVNLSPLVILISLAVWGKIWGIIGMFLGVPLVVIAAIIFANFSKTRPLAILLSEKGKL